MNGELELSSLMEKNQRKEGGGREGGEKLEGHLQARNFGPEMTPIVFALNLLARSLRQHLPTLELEKVARKARRYSGNVSNSKCF